MHILLASFYLLSTIMMSLIPISAFKFQKLVVSGCQMLVNPSRMILSSKWSRDTPSHRFMSTVDRSDSEALIDEYVEELIMMDPIVSTDNSKVKLLKSLQLKKNRDKAGLILLENHRHIIDALQNGNKVKHVLLSEKAIYAPLGAQLVDRLMTHHKEQDFSIDMTNDAIISKISEDVVTPQGVVAAFERPIPQQSDPLSKNPLIVVLDNISDPGNMGTIVRTSYGLGVDSVVMIGGCDPWSSKVVRSAMGMGLNLPIVEQNWKTLLSNENEEKSMMNKMGISFSREEGDKPEVFIADGDESAIPYFEADFTKPCVLIIGSEANGVSEQALQMENAKKIYIPATRKLESFNAAMASAILLGEASRQRR